MAKKARAAIKAKKSAPGRTRRRAAASPQSPPRRKASKPGVQPHKASPRPRRKSPKPSAQPHGPSPRPSRKSPKPKRSTSSAQICDILSIAPKTLSSWVKRGLPHSTSHGQRLFNEAEVAWWMKEHHLTGRPGRPADPANEGIRDAKERKELALARRYELDLAERIGQLHNVEQCHEREALRILALKGGLLDFARGVSPLLAGKTREEIEVLLVKRVDQLLGLYAGEVT